MRENYNSLIFIMLLTFLILLNLNAQVSNPNVINSLKVTNSPKVDGILDEECWENAQRITNFTQRETNNGEPATEKTGVSIVYTATELFIGVWCYFSNSDLLTAKYMRRDFPYWEDDNFEVIFDTFLDKRNGYVFVINPNGARSDVLVTDEGKGFNLDWNGVWDAVTMITDSGWFAEIKIPFSTLKFPAGQEQVWGVNFERNIRAKNEAVFWQGWSRDYDFEYVSNAGKLTGLEGIEGGNEVELKPYLSSGLEISKGISPNYINKFGADANYMLTPTLKLNLTTNTDFAQVESDRAKINLTRFSLFFPEKRDFFLEGKNDFEFNFYENALVFYSRRIGLKEGIDIPIMAGARVIGKLGNSNIGLLSLQTASKGEEKSTNYSVARIKQDVFKQSYAGFIFTAKNQPGNYNYVIGGDFLYYSSDLFGNKNFLIDAAISQSYTKGKENKNNFSYKAIISYPNDEINMNAGTIAIQKNFNPEIGFIERNDVRAYFCEFTYRPRPEIIPWIKRFVFKPAEAVIIFSDISNQLESVHLEVIPFGIVFKSEDYIYFNVNRRFERLDEGFDISDSIHIPAGKHWFTRYEIEAGTYAGRRFSIYSNLATGGFYNGTATIANFGIKWNVNKNINLSTDYVHNYIILGNGKYSTNEFGASFLYAFNPKINTSLFTQWNTNTKEIVLNYRFHWIPVVGSDFYLVLNQFYDTEKNRIELEKTMLLTKFVWRLPI